MPHPVESGRSLRAARDDAGVAGTVVTSTKTRQKLLYPPRPS